MASVIDFKQKFESRRHIFPEPSEYGFSFEIGHTDPSEAQTSLSVDVCACVDPTTQRGISDLPSWLQISSETSTLGSDQRNRKKLFPPPPLPPLLAACCNGGKATKTSSIRQTDLAKAQKQSNKPASSPTNKSLLVSLLHCIFIFISSPRFSPFHISHCQTGF